MCSEDCSKQETDALLRGEGGRWKTGGVVEIRGGRSRPSVANVYGIGDTLAGYENGAVPGSSNDGLRGVELAALTRQLEAEQRIHMGLEPGGVIEVDAHPAVLLGRLTEERSGVFKRL